MVVRRIEINGYVRLLLAVFIVFTLFNVVSSFTEAKFAGEMNKTSGVTVAKPVLTVVNKDRQKEILPHVPTEFIITVSNFEGTVTSEVAMEAALKITKDNSPLRYSYKVYDTTSNADVLINPSTYKARFDAGVKKTYTYKLVVLLESDDVAMAGLNSLLNFKVESTQVNPGA